MAKTITMPQGDFKAYLQEAFDKGKNDLWQSNFDEWLNDILGQWNG